MQYWLELCIFAMFIKLLPTTTLILKMLDVRPGFIISFCNKFLLIYFVNVETKNELIIQMVHLCSMFIATM